MTLNKTKTTVSRKVYLIVGANVTDYGSVLGLNMPRVVSAKHSKTPATKRGEVAIALTIELPKALFKEPAFSAQISVPESKAPGQQIEAEVISNIEQIVTEATGLRLTIDTNTEA